MNDLMQDPKHLPSSESSHSPLTYNPIFYCGLCVDVAKEIVSPPYFCPARTNLTEVNTGCCCLKALCRRVPFRGRHTCHIHGCIMTQQLSDHWWQVGKPGWHTGPLIVRPLICLYRPSVSTPPGCQECSVNSWMHNKRLKCSYCHHQTQNICLQLGCLCSLMQWDSKVLPVY